MFGSQAFSFISNETFLYFKIFLKNPYHRLIDGKCFIYLFIYKIYGKCWQSKIDIKKMKPLQ